MTLIDKGGERPVCGTCHRVAKAGRLKVSRGKCAICRDEIRRALEAQAAHHERIMSMRDEMDLRRAGGIR